MCRPVKEFKTIDLLQMYVSFNPERSSQNFIVRDYYSNGVIIYEIYCLGIKRHGLFSSFNDDGSIYRVCCFQNGDLVNSISCYTIGSKTTSKGILCVQV